MSKSLNADGLEKALKLFIQNRDKVVGLTERMAFLEKALATVDPTDEEMIRSASLQQTEFQLIPKHLERTKAQLSENADAVNRETLNLQTQIEKVINAEVVAFQNQEADSIRAVLPSYEANLPGHGVTKIDGALSAVSAGGVAPCYIKPWGEFCATRLTHAGSPEALISRANLLLEVVKEYESRGGRFVTHAPAIERLQADWRARRLTR